MSYQQPLLPLSEVLRRTVLFYRAHASTILVVTFPVVAFVDVVIGAGLGELTASAHRKVSNADAYISLAADDLVTVPLVTAMIARAVVLDQQRSAPPATREIVEQGLELFVPALVVVLLFICGVVAGLLLLIIPGIYLAVSWYFVVQAVAIDGRRASEAVQQSASLVRGHWWHTAGVLVCLQLAAGLASAIVTGIFAALAQAADSQALTVLGAVLIDTVALPFVALGATLYYLELRDLERAGERIEV
jgi:hypothetical protein